MAGFSDFTSHGVLAHIVGKTAFAMPTAYLALFTGAGTDGGTGFTEVTGGSYARVATSGADWNSPFGSGPSAITNAGVLANPLASADWGAIVAWGLYDAPTGGNLLAWDYLGNFNWVPFTVSLASPAVLTVPSHGFTAGDTIATVTEFGGAYPAFSQSNFSGLLTVVGPTTDTFTVTNAGVAVNTSSTGSALLRKVVPQTVSSGQQFQFPGSNIILTLT